MDLNGMQSYQIGSFMGVFLPTEGKRMGSTGQPKNAEVE